MKNKLTDLNNHLFMALERLGDESINGEKLNEEIERSKAITGVAEQIIDNASLALKAKAFAVGSSNRLLEPPQMFEPNEINTPKKIPNYKNGSYENNRESD